MIVSDIDFLDIPYVFVQLGSFFGLLSTFNRLFCKFILEKQFDQKLIKMVKKYYKDVSDLTNKQILTKIKSKLSFNQTFENFVEIEESNKKIKMIEAAQEMN